jgi:hypothetical protein
MTINVEQGRTYGGGSGEARLYAVEARCTYYSPCMVSDNLVLDRTWRLVPFQYGSPGIPTRTWIPLRQDHLPLVNYQAAKAYAEVFLAELHANLIAGASCVECRIIEVGVKYSYSTSELGVGEIINRTDGDRPKFSTRETTPIPLSARVRGEGEPHGD